MRTLSAMRSRCTECGDCWIWPGAHTPRGYPNMRVDGKFVHVRPLMFDLAGKKREAGKKVTMTCTTPWCVNPAHMTQMSQRELAERARDRGAQANPARAAKIAKHQRQSAKLQAWQVAEIKASAEPTRAVAQRFGVNFATVAKIRRGEMWRDFGTPFAGLGGRA